MDKEGQNEGGVGKKEKKRRKHACEKRVQQGKGEIQGGEERPERGGTKQAERKVNGKEKGVEGERGAPGVAVGRPSDW